MLSCLRVSAAPRRARRERRESLAGAFACGVGIIITIAICRASRWGPGRDGGWTAGSLVLMA